MPAQRRSSATSRRPTAAATSSAAAAGSTRTSPSSARPASPNAARTLDLVAPGNESYETCTADANVRRLRQLRRPAVGHPLLRRHERVGAADGRRRGARHPGVPQHPRRREPVAGARQAADPVQHQRPRVSRATSRAPVSSTPSPRSRPRSPTARTRAPATADSSIRRSSTSRRRPAPAPARDVTVTNDGSSSESYKAKLRTLTNQIGHQQGSVTLQPDGRPDVHQRARRRAGVSGDHVPRPGGRRPLRCVDRVPGAGEHRQPDAVRSVEAVHGVHVPASRRLLRLRPHLGPQSDGRDMDGGVLDAGRLDRLQRRGQVRLHGLTVRVRWERLAVVVHARTRRKPVGARLDGCSGTR